jgi:hypothetical protein
MLQESAPFIPDGEHCDCEWRLETGSACVHEYKKNGGVFVRSLFPDRLLQPHQMKKISPLPDTSDFNDDMLTIIFRKDGDEETVGGTESVAQEPKPGDESSLENNETDAHSLLGKKRIDSGDNSCVSKKAPMKQKKVNRSEMLQVCQSLTDYAVRARPEVGNALFSSVVQLLDIAQGKHSSSDPLEVVDSAAQAVRSRLAPAARHDPLPGPESKKEGRPRTKEYPLLSWHPMVGLKFLNMEGRRALNALSVRTRIAAASRPAPN